MLELAKQYAASQGAQVLAHREGPDAIVFVLSTGPKLTMTRAELEAALSEPEEDAPAPSAAGTPPPAESGASAAKPKKGKAK